jgi:hypothetical protein
MLLTPASTRAEPHRGTGGLRCRALHLPRAICRVGPRGTTNWRVAWPSNGVSSRVLTGQAIDEPHVDACDAVIGLIKDQLRLIARHRHRRARSFVERRFGAYPTIRLPGHADPSRRMARSGTTTTRGGRARSTAPSCCACCLRRADVPREIAAIAPGLAIIVGDRKGPQKAEPTRSAEPRRARRRG